jgi:hypothetical protein
LTHTDDRPVRLVTPDEPPFDPDYDKPDARRPPQDLAAERAVLGALLAEPHLGPQLHPHLERDDFYRPVHGEFWDAWHQLATTTGQTPDFVTLNAHLVNAGRAELVRLVPELLHACPNPAAADTYARIVRDHARLRVVDDLATGLHQIALKGKADQVDVYLGEALQRLDETVTRFGPREHRDNTGLADLSWVTTGDRPVAVPPRWCTRKDGTALFYAGRHNGVFGDPEGGKTWLAQCAGVEALLEGEVFAMIDVDHNGQDHTAARLALLGAPWEAIADPTRFRYYEPEDGDQLRAAVADITRLAPAVTVIDSLGEILPMLGVKSVDNDEITAALRAIVMPPAKAGSCVISVDHLPKSAEARGTGFAIGGTAKKRAVDGAYLSVEAKIKPAPGQIGRIMLRIEKDRTGELRRTSGGGYAGTFVLDSTDTETGIGSTTWSIGRDQVPTNEDGSFRPTSFMEKVAQYIADNDNCTQRDLERDLPGKASTLRDAVKVLVSEGHVARIKGPRGANQHTLLIPYREAEDDRANPDS